MSTGRPGTASLTRSCGTGSTTRTLADPPHVGTVAGSPQKRGSGTMGWAAGAAAHLVPQEPDGRATASKAERSGFDSRLGYTGSTLWSPGCGTGLPGGLIGADRWARQRTLG